MRLAESRLKALSRGLVSRQEPRCEGVGIAVGVTTRGRRLLLP